jgi:hypothetical protein
METKQNRVRTIRESQGYSQDYVRPFKKLCHLKVKKVTFKFDI